MTDLLKMIGILLLAGLGIPLLIAMSDSWGVWGRELYAGQYDNVSPFVRDWFARQQVPGGPQRGMSCCSVADGTYAEEDIRKGADGTDHYWTRYKTPAGDSDWQEVPDEALIQAPNPNGAAVVWYWFSDGKPKIRCFIPGGGV